MCNNTGVLQILLNDALQQAEIAFAGRDTQSYFGRARLLEELALVKRYDANKTINSLEEGIKICEESIMLYDKAICNALKDEDNEMVARTDAIGRMLRVIGIKSTIAMGIYHKSSDPEKRSEYLFRAVEYADLELSLRNKNSEVYYDIPGLMNAHHTLGVARTEMAAEMKERNGYHYMSARENLDTAQKYAKELNQQMVSSVIDFRLAWLEYKAGIRNSMLCGLMDKVIASQQNPAAAWSKAVKDALKDKMFELGNYLGEEIRSGVEQMYSNARE
jgi:hypothetical protein